MLAPRFLRAAAACRATLYGLAAMAVAVPGFAQSAGPQVSAPRVEDILVSQTDDAVTILVKLSAQPTAASARTEADALLVEIDGVALAPFEIDPPKGVLVGHVEGQPSGDGGSQLILSGAALRVSDTIVYRNAVLVKATLAEPVVTEAASLMGAPEQPAAAPVPPPAAAAAQPATTDPVQTKSSGPVVADLAGISSQRCDEAPVALKADQWDLAALGDHALCLLKSGKADEGKNRLDQLAAFQPEDWRVALGRADLALRSGDLSAAIIGLNNAGLLAPTDASRAAIQAAARSMTDAAPETKENPPQH